MNQFTPEQIAALTEFLRDTYRIRKAETMKITLTGVLLVVAIERLQHLAVAGSLYSVVKDWYRDTTGRELQVVTFGGARLYTVPRGTIPDGADGFVFRLPRTTPA